MSTTTLPPRIRPPTVLTPGERATLANVCETLLPALNPEAGDVPRLFALDATSIGVPDAMEQAIAALHPEQRAQFRRLLRMLERPLAIRLLIGSARRYSALSRSDRERVLRAMATSRLAALRSGFQGLKRLATFLFYTLPDANGSNPTWPAIGYAPSSNPPSIQAPLRLTTVTQPTTFECDVCVVGSGAGGGVVAAELARAGKRVLVLEAGSGRQAPDFDQRELPGMQGLYLDGGMTATRDLQVAILAGGTLGGGTTVNWQTSLRPLDATRDEWATLSGCRHFVEDSFTRSLDAVMARLGVSAAESIVNPNNATLRRGCAALGYEWSTIERNAHGCDAEQCGYCVFGCRRGGKQSTALTFLQDAQRTGDTTIVAGCRADRVLIAGGSVVGIRAAAMDPATGREHAVEVRAQVVVVAAGAIHSPALLLRSGIRLPALGRNLYLHPVGAVAGVYDEVIEPWRGPPQTILSGQFAQLNGNYGYRLESAPAHPGLIALALPWISAQQHRRLMQQAAHISAIFALVRDRTGGRVRLGPSGQPVVDYRPGKQERAHLRHGIEQAARIHIAAGAREVVTGHTREHHLRNIPNLPPSTVDAFCRTLGRATVDRNWSLLFSAHQMGTCRMGSDPRTAVCDARGEVYGVRGLFIGDASAFPASSGVNPMITVMALAYHTAQFIKAH